MEVKIGSGWVYDTDKCRGSEIVYKPNGEVSYYKPIFTVLLDVEKAKDSRYTSERRKAICKVKVIDYSKSDLPLGIVRKAIDMQILEYSGKLNKLNLDKEKVM